MEELNKIAQIIAALSDKGAESFQWYLAYKCFDSLLGCVLVAGIGALIYKGVIYAINQGPEKRALDAIRSAVNAQAKTPFLHLSSFECDGIAEKAIEIIRKNKDA